VTTKSPNPCVLPRQIRTSMTRACVVILGLACEIAAVGASFRRTLESNNGMNERDWFVPQHHSAEIMQFITGWQGEQSFSAFDAFARSSSTQRVWEHYGYRAVRMDLHLGGNSHDLLSEEGFYVWLDHLMQMHHGGILVAFPPSGMFIPLMRSLHRRNTMIYDIYGDRSSLTVRRANCILKNFVALLENIHTIRRLHIVIVQPFASLLFETPEYQHLRALLGLSIVSTWLGLFGHVGSKRVRVLTNLPGHTQLRRRMTDLNREMIRARWERFVHRSRYFQRQAESLPLGFCQRLFELWAVALMLMHP